MLSTFAWCSFWFRFKRVWKHVRVTPIETYRAVSITSSAAKDVVTEMVTDSVQQARYAVEEARAVAERSRAKAELLEDRPCPDVSSPHMLQEHTFAGMLARQNLSHWLPASSLSSLLICNGLLTCNGRRAFIQIVWYVLVAAVLHIGSMLPCYK